MALISAVTVYCSSSSAVAAEYHLAAKALGFANASEGWRLVYGGNFVGLMADVAQGAREGGGKVTGFTPQLMVDNGISDKQANDLLITNNMRDRKVLLETRGDVFIAMPGGLGLMKKCLKFWLDGNRVTTINRSFY